MVGMDFHAFPAGAFYGTLPRLLTTRLRADASGKVMKAIAT
jgi:hypothetical protein